MSHALVTDKTFRRQALPPSSHRLTSCYLHDCEHFSGAFFYCCNSAYARTILQNFNLVEDDRFHICVALKHTKHALVCRCVQMQAGVSGLRLRESIVYILIGCGAAILSRHMNMSYYGRQLRWRCDRWYHNFVAFLLLNAR